MPTDEKLTRNERLKDLSRERRDKQRQELRQTILDAAVELFVQNGYRGFSMRQVAEHIGYSATTIYLYFSDKDELLFNVADEGFRRFNTMQQEAAASNPDFIDRLKAMAHAYVQFGLSYPAYYRLMFIERPDLLFLSRQESAMEWLKSLSAFQDVFREAMQAGVVRQGDPVQMSDGWWATLHGIVALSNSMPFLFDVARVWQTLDSAIEMFFRGFGNTG